MIHCADPLVREPRVSCSEFGSYVRGSGAGRAAHRSGGIARVVPRSKCAEFRLVRILRWIGADPRLIRVSREKLINPHCWLVDPLRSMGGVSAIHSEFGLELVRFGRLRASLGHAQAKQAGAGRGKARDSLGSHSGAFPASGTEREPFGLSRGSDRMVAREDRSMASARDCRALYRPPVQSLDRISANAELRAFRASIARRQTSARAPMVRLMRGKRRLAPKRS